MFFSGGALRALFTPHLGTSAEAGADSSRQVHELFHRDSGNPDDFPEGSAGNITRRVDWHRDYPAVSVGIGGVASALALITESQSLQCTDYPPSG